MSTFGAASARSFGAQRGVALSVDPFFANVSLLMHMEGANNGTVFTDQKGATPTRTGTPVTSTTQFKYGATSGKFNGSTDYLDFPTIAAYAFGTGDFTQECWIFPTSFVTVGTFICSASASAQDGCNAYVNGSGRVVLGNHLANYLTSTVAVVVNTWSHVAVTRSGTTLTVWINGVSAGTATNSINMTSQVARVGGSTDAHFFPGYIDEVRVTKGVARYTGTFTPATGPFPNS
jgi:hypothetical protein